MIQAHSQSPNNVQERDKNYMDDVASHGKVRPPSVGLIRMSRMGSFQNSYLPMQEEILGWSEFLDGEDA